MNSNKIVRLRIASEFCFALLAVCFMDGCYAYLNFYPVQGPLAGQTPVPTLIAKFTGPFKSGNLSLVLPDGEKCTGRWTQTPTVSGDPMASVWDQVYGQGFYVGHVLGSKLYAIAAVTGNRGTVLNVRMYKSGAADPHRIGTIKGIAKDTGGNVYKISERD